MYLSFVWTGRIHIQLLCSTACTSSKLRSPSESVLLWHQYITPITEQKLSRREVLIIHTALWHAIVEQLFGGWTFFLFAFSICMIYHVEIIDMKILELQNCQSCLRPLWGPEVLLDCSTHIHRWLFLRNLLARAGLLPAFYCLKMLITGMFYALIIFT